MRLLSTILFLLFSTICFSQTFPTIQGIGNKTAIVQTQGTFGSLTGYTWVTDYTDTTTANLALYVKFTPGIVIRCGTSFFVRNNAASAWVSVGGGGGGGGLTTASNGLTAVVNDVQLGGRLTKGTTVSGANFPLKFDSLGSGTRFIAVPVAFAPRNISIVNTNGTDSAYLKIGGATSGGVLRQAIMGVNRTSGNITAELSVNDIANAPKVNITVLLPTVNTTQILADTTKVLLYKAFPATSRFSYVTLYNDSLTSISPFMDQYVLDSANWRMNDRTAAFNLRPGFAHIYADDSTLFESDLGVYTYTDLQTGTTADKVALFDANGHLKQIAMSSIIGVTPTWQQTLTAGSTLTGDNTIVNGANTLTISGTPGNIAIMQVASTGNGGFPLYLTNDFSSTNNNLSGLVINRTTSGTAANGIGTGIDFWIEDDISDVASAGSVRIKWTDASHNTRTSQFDLLGTSSGSSQTFMNIQTSGVTRVNNNADTLATKAYARSAVGGVGTTWNSIGNPSGDQALTFSVGNSSTWTNQNTTEDMFTVNDATTTTSSLFSINRTSTAITTGNNMMELISSGAMGSGTTANGLVITMTNTGTTSVLRGLNVSVSGATTNTAAIFTGNVGMGTPTPSVQLEVNGTVQGNSFQTTSTAVNGVFQTASTTGAVGSSSAPILLPNNATGSAYRVQTNGTVCKRARTK